MKSGNNAPSIAVYILTHGPECQWIADYCIPLEIGAACRTNHCCDTRDDTGDNISFKDNTYCELTGLYWMWKNDTHDITGLYHYRRVFRLTEDEIRNYLKTADIIIPKQDYPGKPSIEENYCINHIPKDWEVLKQALKKLYPDYYETAETVFHDDVVFGRNMFICNHRQLDTYCSWLFPLLTEIETHIDLNDGRTTYDKRVFGYMAERLFTLYIIHNCRKNNLKIKQVQVWNIPDEKIFSKKCPTALKKIVMSNAHLYQHYLYAQEELNQYLRRRKLGK